MHERPGRDSSGNASRKDNNVVLEQITFAYFLRYDTGDGGSRCPENRDRTAVFSSRSYETSAQINTSNLIISYVIQYIKVPN
jgi:hypothetical protein